MIEKWLYGIKYTFAVGFTFFWLDSARAVLGPTLTLREALDLSESYNPQLKVEHARELAARHQVEIEQSYYYPDLSLEAIDSTGFPGSSGALGETGLMGSPFRSGFSTGAVLTQNIYDFGRTHYKIKFSDSEAQSQEQATDISRYQSEQEVIQAYFDCVLKRTEKETWEELLKDTRLVEKQAEVFIDTGQRSIVDRYLSKAQTEDVQTHISDFEAQELVSIERLSIITGITHAFECSPIEGLTENIGLRTSTHENPITAYAQLQLNGSQALLDQAKAKNLPIIVGMASFGYMHQANLVNSQDYSFGIGLSIPIFEGFRIKNEVSRSAALVSEKDHLLAVSKLNLKDTDRKYQEKIISADTRRRHLTDELKIAQDAFRIAKHRYFAMQGDLVDLRDSVSNLERVVDNLDRARVEYLELTALQAVLNGAR